MKYGRDFYFLRYLFFVAPAGLFFWSVAPSIPSGPGGTFTLVVGAGGNANPTGYPLFSIISRLFSFLLPFEDVAYKFNLAAAAMGFLSLLLVFGISVFVTQAYVSRSRQPIGHFEFFALASFVSSGFFMSEALSRVSFLSDRYSTNLAVVMLISLFLVKLSRDFILDKAPKLRDFYLMTICCSLVLSTHLTMIPFACLSWLIGLSLCLQAKQRLSVPLSVLSILIGLLPLLYLPINGSFDPLFNWGEPDTLNKFWYHFTRAEYGKMKQRAGMAAYLELLGRDWGLLLKQFSVLHLSLCLIGLVTLLIASWKSTTLLTLLVITLGPLISYVWPWPPLIDQNLFTETLTSLLVKYFSTYYLLLIGLGGLGVVTTVRRLGQMTRQPIAFRLACSIVIIAGLAGSIYGADLHNKRDYRLWQDLAANVERQVPERGVIFTFYDTCYSQLAYQQIHKGLLKDRFIIHTNLLFRGWYIDTLSRLYPFFFKQHKGVLNELNSVSRKVEAGDMSLIPKVNQLKNTALKEIALEHHKTGVFNCPDPLRDDSSRWSSLGFAIEPIYYLQRLHVESHGLNKIDLASIHYRNIKAQARGGDPFAKGILVTGARSLRERSQIYKSLEPAYYEAANQLADEMLYELGSGQK